MSIGRARLPEKLEFAIYRIVQEMVNNSLKHAQATQTQVKTDATEEYISLDITGNGIGLKESELSDTSKGIGPQTVRNRANLPGSSGTHVQIALPL